MVADTGGGGFSLLRIPHLHAGLQTRPCRALPALAQTREVLEAMVADVGGGGFSLLRVDGGASQNGLLMQLQADAIQVFVSSPCSSACHWVPARTACSCSCRPTPSRF